MRRSHRGVRRWVVGAALVPLLGVLTACSDPDPVAELVASAESAAPDQLRMLSSEAGADGSAEVVFALRDDPDAGLVLRAGSNGSDRSGGEGRDGNGGGIDADQVRSAIQDARARAERYRLLDESFRRCGFTVVAVTELGRSTHETAWVAAVDDKTPLDRVPPLVQPCRADWVFPADNLGTTVKLVGADVVAGLPAADPALPIVLRVTGEQTTEALKLSSHYTVEATRIRPEWPPKEWQELRPRISEWISGWLDERGVGHVTGNEVYHQRRLIAGEPGRMRYYEMICTERETSWRCRGPAIGVAAVTVNLGDLTVSDPRLITTVREPNQIPLDTPLEPKM